MLSLFGDTCYLRALEPEDLEFIFLVENNEDFWEVSSTQTPYSKFLIKQYLENAHLDIYEVKQLRLVICKNDTTPIGLIDLFDFNPAHRRAGVGILITEIENRANGYGEEALQLLMDYGKKHLHLHQLYANIGVDNTASIRLFEKMNFTKIGLKKDWNLVAGKYKDELLYQLRYVH